MAVSLADFTTFFQDECKSIKRGENPYKSAHVESCSYSKVELVGSVVRGGKMFSYTTGVVVVIIPYFHKLIHQPFDDKQTFFTWKSQIGSKNNFPFPVDYRSYFFHTKVPWGPPEGAWLRHSIVRAEVIVFSPAGSMMSLQVYKACRTSM